MFKRMKLERKKGAEKRQERNMLPSFFNASRGMTLLELMMAMFILSFILLGGFTLNLSTARSTQAVAQNVTLENELIYIFREIESSIMDGYQATVTPASGSLAGASSVKMEVEKSSTAANAKIAYEYFFTGQSLKKYIYDSDGNLLDTITISTDTLRLPSKADLDGDGDVDDNDLNLYNSIYAANGSCSPPLTDECEKLNFNNDLNVDSLDKGFVETDCNKGENQPPRLCGATISPFEVTDANHRFVKINFSSWKQAPEGKWIRTSKMSKTVLLRLTSAN